MAFRIPTRHFTSVTVRRLSSQATAASNLSQNVQESISREATLPNPDPSDDSASAALVKDHSKFMLATYARPPPVFVKGQGSYLWDLENRKYLDFTAGIAVNALGHSDPGLAKVISDQVRAHSHSPVHFSSSYIIPVLFLC